MPRKLTDIIIKALPLPAKGNKIEYDSEVKGFGCRVTAGDARAFVLNYRTVSGRERRYTIGSFPDWTTGAAREEAKSLKRQIDGGADPLGEIEKAREGKSMADLCARYIEDYLPGKRPTSQLTDRGMIDKEILPALKHLKIADVTFNDVDALHRKIRTRGRKIRANRVLALVSTMFSLAEKWEWRPRGTNPAKGVTRADENQRDRFLSGEEIARLTEALAEHPDQQAANIIRLLLLTGARRGEVFSIKWADLDLEAGVWTKPAVSTKQKKPHRIPLSPPARQLLLALQEAAGESEYVFPGKAGGHRLELKYDWSAICKVAGIREARVHDLRHTYASLLASAGQSLPIIGALLGHTRAQTTMRYAHLYDEPLRQATDRVGAIVAPTNRDNVAQFKRGA